MSTDYKKYKTTTLAITRDINSFDEQTENLYESIVIISKRANQISMEMKEELTEKMKEFATGRDTMEEILENREQIDLAKHYEQMPKSTLMAVQEYLDKQIYFRRPEK